jgi:hypothetical protein
VTAMASSETWMFGDSRVFWGLRVLYTTSMFRSELPLELLHGSKRGREGREEGRGYCGLKDEK